MNYRSEEFLTQLNDGMYDDDLEALKQAIKDRQTSTRESRSVADYKMGQRVVFNDYCGTKYMRGQTGVVVDRARTKLLIKLDRPVGRFSKTNATGVVEGAEVKAPPSILDLVS